MSAYRWLINTIDRVAMVEEVINEFSASEISINSMEVFPCKIYVKFNAECERDVKLLLSKLLLNPDVISVTRSKLQPYERKEKELQAILESTTDGIIGINNQGNINYFNKVAEDFFSISRENIVGVNISKILSGKNQAVLTKLLGGNSFDHYQMVTSTPKGELYYICSGRPILSEESQVMGAVITFKSLRSVQQMASSVNKSLPFSFDDIICESEIMMNLIDFAKKISISPYTVLIRGETGTGKELFARAIHNASDRSAHPFAPINCAALPENLIESELFGYEGGAFSGASKGGKMGLFESANHGTVFLDEFGELSLILQSKLLRVLQEGVIRRVGGHKEIPVDVRIIVATNRNLEEMIENKSFREDLYYRINVIPINIPPLKERKTDIPLLLQRFIRKYTTELNKQLSLSQDAYHQLMAYSWPGNVRELQNVILRAIHLASGREITVGDLWLPHEEVMASPALRPKAAPKTEIPPAVLPVQEDINLKETLARQEKSLLEDYLRRYGSARKVSREIGMSHTTVLNKARYYNLEHLLTYSTVRRSADKTD